MKRNTMKTMLAAATVAMMGSNVLLCIIGGLKVFDIIIAMTNGGPGMSTQVLNTIIDV